MLVKRWVGQKLACKKCGKTNVKYHAKGLCKTCYACLYSRKRTKVKKQLLNVDTEKQVV